MTQREDARLAGYAYLTYIACAMASTILFGKATAGDNAAEVLSTLARMMGTARVSVLLGLLQPICALVLAVTLYRLSKAVNPTVALLAMLFRAGEGLLVSLPLLSQLELMRLAAASAGSASGASSLAIANEILHSPNDFSAFCFVVGGFLFACLFLQGRLIPRWLAWIGVITIGAQLICVPLHIATMIPGSIVNWMWFPILLYEVPLGFWLILRGTEHSRDSAIALGAED